MREIFLYVVVWHHHITTFAYLNANASNSVAPGIKSSLFVDDVCGLMDANIINHGLRSAASSSCGVLRSMWMKSCFRSRIISKSKLGQINVQKHQNHISNVAKRTVYTFAYKKSCEKNKCMCETLLWVYLFKIVSRWSKCSKHLTCYSKHFGVPFGGFMINWL